MTRKTRFTDAEYAEMAADYEANPPRTDEISGPIEVNPAFLRKGRRPKSVDAASGRTPLTTVRLPEPIRLELTRRAEAEGASASELIRRAVVEYFDAHPA